MEKRRKGPRSGAPAPHAACAQAGVDSSGTYASFYPAARDFVLQQAQQRVMQLNSLYEAVQAQRRLMRAMQSRSSTNDLQQAIAHVEQFPQVNAGLLRRARDSFELRRGQEQRVLQQRQEEARRRTECVQVALGRARQHSAPKLPQVTRASIPLRCACPLTLRLKRCVE